jgi:hypothetical protein
MRKNEYKKSVRVRDLWLFERMMKPAVEGVDSEHGMMGSIRAFQVLESALKDQLQQFGEHTKATRFFELSVPWEYRSEWTQAYLNSLRWNNRTMRFSIFRTLKLSMDTQTDHLEVSRVGDQLGLRLNKELFMSLVDGVEHRSSGNKTGFWCFEDEQNSAISFSLPPLGDWFDAE